MTVGLILCKYRKMDTTIHGNCASIQPAFSAYRAQLTRKPSTPLERSLNFGPEADFIFTLYNVPIIFAFEEHGNTYEPVRMYACDTYEQPATNIICRTRTHLKNFSNIASLTCFGPVPYNFRTSSRSGT